MEHISNLQSIQNKYPNLQNYKKSSDTLFTLFGNYNQNKLNFDIKSFSDIIVVPNTTFNFLLLIKTNDDDNGQLYTSSRFFKLMEEAFNTVNPYFLQFIRKNELVIELNLSEIISLYETFEELEERDKVTVLKNVFFEITDDENNPYTINFIKLVEYIDWVVSEVDPNQKDGVLDVKTIAEYIVEERESLNPALSDDD